jgi:hypothetical protein
MNNVAKVCKLPGFRYFVFPRQPIPERPTAREPVATEAAPPMAPVVSVPVAVAPTRPPQPDFTLIDDVSHTTPASTAPPDQMARRLRPSPRPEPPPSGPEGFALLAEINAEIGRRRPGPAPDRQR